MDKDSGSADESKPLISAKRHPLKIIAIIALIIIGGIGLSLVLYTRDTGQIAKGIVLEIPLGQLTFADAQSKLEQQRTKLYEHPLQLTAGEKTFSFTMKELGFTYSYEKPLQQAYLIGREGNIVNKAAAKFKASWGITFTPDYEWNNQTLSGILTQHLSSLNMPAENAHFIVNPDDSMQIVAEKVGKQVDLENLITSIKKAPIEGAAHIPIPFKSIKPGLTQEDLEKVKSYDLISEYSTIFDLNQKERTINLKLAAQAIDGLVLKPGETFSFNQTVGPRTVEAGYQEAIIIEGNSFVPGLGGGVCQVSSTLYNAVRLVSSSVTVIERSRHSLPVAYVPPGQDATVAYPDLDFKFRNDSGDFILIRSDINGHSLNFKLYGKAKKKQ
ncbi:VanW family protein [Desulfosporosinus sp. FKA]|uniref:VanW family protein n=1 Tax=Desulfosporosinus sp. FKA TaxID=1969834 RepID=UPI000B49AA8A|nr:VanW family protein [Desulfosporosinus sp. FKA]